MLDALHASPSVGAYRAEPYDTNEIDAHPDRDRIWATIMRAKISTDKEISEMEEDYAGELDEAADAATKDEAQRCFEAVECWADQVEELFGETFADPRSKKAAEWLLAEIAKVGDAL